MGRSSNRVVQGVSGIRSIAESARGACVSCRVVEVEVFEWKLTESGTREARTCRRLLLP